MDYYPEGWIAIKIQPKSGGAIYKIFGSWSGGYLQGDAWRLNSGVESIEKGDDTITCNGYSGSAYICDVETYGRISGYNQSVLTGLLSKSNDEYTISVYDTLEEFLQDYEGSDNVDV